MLIVLKNSLGGRARGLATVAGIALGLGLQTTALSAGFTLLAGHTATIFEVLRWGGAGVLVFIGTRALFSRASTTGESPPVTASDGNRSAFVEGLLCNLTNPKAFLFFTGVFSQLINPSSPRWLSFALPVLFTVHGAVCWTVVSSLVQSRPVASRLQRAQGVLVRFFGALLVLFGLGLVIWRP